MSSFKKVDLSRDFCVRGVDLSEAQNPIPSLTHCIHEKQYTYSHVEGGGGGESLTREGERGKCSQSCVKNTT
jgi:hypothetical protein